MTSRWVLPRGTAGSDEWDVVVDATIEGWSHTGLYAGRLGAGDRRTLDAGLREVVVVPLSGSVRVTCTDAAGTTHTADLVGRPSVFAGPTDVAYVPRSSALAVESEAGCRVALAVAALPETAPSERPAFRHLPAAEVPTELRGAGQSSREVRNFGVPGVLEAERLIACEVVTPAGNWSSYPPHKHDE
ncbi:MAG: 5-deoxy-glucuronate isomerase, partial [Lapillicoccus sp.]